MSDTASRRRSRLRRGCLPLLGGAALILWFLALPTSVTRFHSYEPGRRTVTIHRDDSVVWSRGGNVTLRALGSPGLFRRVSAILQDWSAEAQDGLDGGCECVRIAYGFGIRWRTHADCPALDDVWVSLGFQHPNEREYSLPSNRSSLANSALFHSFPEGMVWTYDGEFAGESRTVSYRVTSVVGGVRHVKCDVFHPGEPGSQGIEGLAWREKDGDVEWCIEETDGRLTPCWRIWEKGAVPDRNWPGPDGSFTRYVGDEAIEVPAGRYDRAAHMRVLRYASVDLWFAPEVGMIKMVRRSAVGTDQLTLRRVERPR